MSLNRRIAFGAAASWFSRGVSILLGLVVLPVLFRHLPKEELGIWLLLGQSWAALGIFDLGFGVTLTRRIAFAKGKSGGDPAVALTDETLVEIADLVETGKRVYRLLALFAFIFSMVAGFFYLKSLNLGNVPFYQVWLAWAVICLGQAMGVWANIWNCVLLGVGYVGWDSVLGSLANALTLLAQIAVVLLGGGLVALAVTGAAGALAQRFLMLGFARKRRPEIFSIRGKGKLALVKNMVPLAARAWITALGATLVLYTDQILIASMSGASAVPAYRAAFVLIHNLTVISVTLGMASSVFISHLWQAGEIKQVQRIVEKNVLLGWLTMLTGAACLLVVGRQLFELWLGPGNFIGYAVIGAFLITETLETQSYIIATASRATEDEAFAFSAIAGGVLKLGLSWLFAKQFGLLGIAMGTVIGLLLTNHWYMVYRGLRRLKISLREYAKTVLLPCGLVFPGMLGVLWLVRSLSQETTPVAQLASVSMTAALLFGAAVWFLVLDLEQRAKIVRVLKLEKNAPLFRSPFHMENIRGHTICEIGLNSESVVVDAGAHRGEFSRTLMERYGCQCLLVEANPSLAARLIGQNFRHVLPAALSAEDGKAMFITRQNPEAGGIFDRIQDDGNAMAEVKTISLETLMRQFDLPRIDLLKLDIEGAEFDLIDKTSDLVLSSVGQITAEFHDFLPDFKDRGLYEKAKCRLESLGFVACCMTFRTHGDVLFLNRKMFRTNPPSRAWLRYGARWPKKLKSLFKVGFGSLKLP